MLRSRLDELADLVAVPARHEDVGEDEIEGVLAQLPKGKFTVADGDDIDSFIGERQVDDLLNRDAVIGQQDLVRHSGPPRRADCRLQNSTFGPL